MPLPLAILAWFFIIYAAVGTVVGAFFCFRGVQAVDPAAQNATITFRIIILPAAAALWPWVLLIWRQTLRRHSPNRGGVS